MTWRPTAGKVDMESEPEWHPNRAVSMVGTVAFGNLLGDPIEHHMVDRHTRCSGAERRIISRDAGGMNRPGFVGGSNS